MLLNNPIKRSLNSGDPINAARLVQLFGGGNPSGSGITVTRGNALTLSAVWRALQVRSGAVAASALRARDRDSLDIVDLPLFEKVHPLFTTYQWARMVTLHLDTAGDHFSIIGRGSRLEGSQVTSLYPLDPHRVVVEWLYRKNNPTIPIGRKYTVHSSAEDAAQGVSSGNPRVYFDDEILHIPGLNFNGLRGLSVLGAASESLGTAMAGELYAGKLYGNGSLMSGILKTDKRLEEDKADSVKARWQSKVAGLAHAGEAVVLDSGLEFESMTINPIDAQFIQSRDFGVDEVARWFGVPVRYLMKSGSAASVKQQVEQDSIEFSLHGLEPVTANIEASLDEVIHSTMMSDFDLSRFQRGDTKTRSGAHLLARKAGYMTRNEIRQAEGLPRIEDERADDIFDPLDDGAPSETGGEDMGGVTDDQGEGNDGEPAGNTIDA